MCELLAINANTSVPVTLAWRAFQHRGGLHPDGWGFAYIERGRFAVERHLTNLAADRRGREAPTEVRTRHFLGHVRYQMQGAISPENTQPFLCAEEGRAIAATMSNCRITSRFRSEVLDRIAGETGPEVLFALLCDGEVISVLERVFLSTEVGPRARASFVVSNGSEMHAFSFNRPVFLLTRRPPHDAVVRLRDPNQQGFTANLRLEKGSDEVATIIASTPLTDEEWIAIGHREFVTIRDGEIKAVEQL